VFKVALLGVGRIGSLHGRTLAAHPDFDLRYVVDPRADVARAFAAEVAASAASSAQALGDPDIDAVVIASSTDTHLELCLAAARAGKAIWCEKPLDLDLLRLRQSRPALESAKDRLLIGFQRRFDPNFRALHERLVAGEIGRTLGLNIPELVFINIDAALGRNDPDAEIRHLLKASVGLNLALDYLPGSTTFDPAARETASPAEASLAVWFDAFTQNVDRTPRNANLLTWHRKLYFIDHGAALFFHHNWPTIEQKIASPFAEIQNHVLLPWASQIEQASAIAHSKLTSEVLKEILDLLPDEWLEDKHEDHIDAAQRRAAYLDFFVRRLAASSIFEEEAIRAHASLI